MSTQKPKTVNSNHNLSVTFYGGVGTVTGANFLLKAEDLRVLVDCGLTQGVPESNKLNQEDFRYLPDNVDFLIVTHAHIDHIGRIPKLVKAGFQGTIYSTPETKEISEHMLADALKVMEYESRSDPSRMPLYSTYDLEKTFSLWKTFAYHETRELSTNLSMMFKDAGHILGSAMVEFSYTSAGEVSKILFTGDLGSSPTPLLNDTESPAGANYLIMESVYGDRNHESVEQRRENFRAAVVRGINRGGTILIPAFSLERSQVILYELNNLVEDELIPSVPVFLDSPLAIKLTQVYQGSKKLFKPEVQKEIAAGDNIFSFSKLKFTVTGGDSREIEEVAAPKIIIAGSGMSTGGRIVRHEGKHLPDPKNLVLLMGYQALGTPGRLLQDGIKEIEIDGQVVSVKAEVVSITGYSSHKDSEHLLEFVESAGESLQKVFVVMGEPRASMFLAQRINDYLGVKAEYPDANQEYFLN